MKPLTHFNQNYLQMAISAYAAIVATAVAVVQVYSYLTDRRARVKLTVRYRMSNPAYGETTFTLVSAVNAGKKPVTIEGFAVEYFKDGIARSAALVDFVPPVPCKLTEGEVVTAKLNDSTLNPENVINYFAWDSLGNYFRIRRRGVSILTALRWKWGWRHTKQAIKKN